MQLTSRLANDECRNWVEVGQALLFLSETVHSHAPKEIRNFYDLLAAKVGPGKCHCTYAPGKHNTLSCKWAQVIMSYHRDPAKIIWQASNSSKWDDATSGPLEIASVYIGKHSVEGLGYLRFLRRCSYFSVKEKVLSDVIDVWEKLWATAPNQKLGHDDKLRAFDAITKILHESLFRNDPHTKKTLKDIQSIAFWDVPRLQVAEVNVARYYREMLEKKRLKMSKVIMDLDANLENVECFLTKIQDPCQRTSVPLQDSLFWFYNFLTVSLSYFTKSRKSQELMFGFFRFFVSFFHSTFVVLVLVVIMVLVGSVTMLFSVLISSYVAKLV